MIYWRQKVLLALLKNAPEKKASKIQLVKWLFLLKEEEHLNNHGSFYDFLPYKFGPFSFLVYRDINKLEQFGLVNSDDVSFQSTSFDKQDIGNALPPKIVNSISKILYNYGRIPQQHLIDYIYKKYPWYASRSEINNLQNTCHTEKVNTAIHSLGYEALSIDTFLNAVLKRGISNVIDIRSNPISHKYGFSKSSLENKCKEVKIDYCHFSEVGIPSKIRKVVDNRTILWEIYRDTILPMASKAINAISEICVKKPSVLLCFEKDHSACHRGILASEIASKTGLPIFHYQGDINNWVKE